MDILYLVPQKMRIVNGYKNEDTFDRSIELIKRHKKRRIPKYVYKRIEECKMINEKIKIKRNEQQWFYSNKT